MGGSSSPSIIEISNVARSRPSVPSRSTVKKLKPTKFRRAVASLKNRVASSSHSAHAQSSHALPAASTSAGNPAVPLHQTTVGTAIKAATSAPVELRRCATCGDRVTGDQRYSNCRHCRKKNREQTTHAILATEHHKQTTPILLSSSPEPSPKTLPVAALPESPSALASTTEPTPLSTSQPTLSERAQLRHCTGCRRVLSPAQSYKNCDSCRQKHREQSRRYWENRRARESLAESSESVRQAVSDRVQPSDAKTQEMEVKAAVKRKAGEILSALNAKKRKTANEETELDRTTTIRPPLEVCLHLIRTRCPHRWLQSRGEPKEYQSQDTFYKTLVKKLRRKIKAARVFHGSYAIVMTQALLSDQRPDFVKQQLRKMKKLRSAVVPMECGIRVLIVLLDF
jgi:hypothetical protein